MKKETKRAFLELHLAVLLWGFTAILGEIINVPTLALVWWRVTLTVGLILIFTPTLKAVKQLPTGIAPRFMGIGFIVVLHWLCFYGSIKLANASVALICMATTSFLSAILEPLILRQKIKWYEVALGIIIIPGMVFIAGNLPDNFHLGFIVGLLAAVLVVIFSILNKKWVDTADPLSITFLNLGGGWILLTVLLPIYIYFMPEAIFLPPTLMDWVYILVLVVLCTNLAYWLGLRALKHLSAFATNLTVNLEPLYGISLAWLLLDQNKQLNASFYWGAALILVAVLSYPLLRSRYEKQG